MSIINQFWNWITLKKERQHNIPLWMVLQGTLARLSGTMLLLIAISILIPIGQQPGDIEIGLMMVIFSKVPLGNGFIITRQKHYVKHILAIPLGLSIITIPLALWYYYRKENVVKYFNQFKKTEE